MSPKGQNVGYIRVSTADQNTERQLANIGIELDRVFEDKLSGKDLKRPQLQACLSHCRAGDTLHVHSIDRLARNLKDLQQTIEDDLLAKGVAVVFHKEQLTFTPPMSDGGIPLSDQHKGAMQRLMLQMMGAFAEFERSLIRERQREGIAAAKAQGKHLGRPRRITDETIKDIVKAAESGDTKAQIASRYGISRTKLWQILKDHTEGTE